MSNDLFENLLASLSLDDLRGQRDRYTSQVDDLRQRIDAIERVIAVLSRMQPVAPEPKGQKASREQTVALTDLVREMERPSLIDAIERVMQNGASSAQWSANEVLRQLTERGWAPTGKTPKNSVAAMLSRLRVRGVVERTAPGLYRLAEYGPQSSPSEAPEGADPQLRVGEGR